MDILLGNVFSLIAMVTDSISSSRKTTKGMLIFQTISQLLYSASSIVLKGYSAVVQNLVSVARNLFAINKKESKIIEWSLVAAGVVLGIYFNNLGVIGFLPVIANFQYSVCVFKFRDKERPLKISFLIMVAMYTAFNLIIMNFVGAASNLFVFATTAVFLIKAIRGQKEKTEK